MQISQQDQQYLISETNKFLQNTYRNACLISSSPGEVLLVEELHKGFETKNLEQRWQKVFQDCIDHIKISSFFIHKSPVVKYTTAPRGVEFGDILFDYNEYSQQGIAKFRNALLLQAKISSATICPVQRELYGVWPKFWFQSPSELGGCNYDLKENSYHDGARYLIIENDPHSLVKDRYLTFLTDQNMFIVNSEISLAEQMVGLVTENAGRKINYNPIDEWSKVIIHVSDWAKDQYFKYNTRKRKETQSLNMITRSNITTDGNLKRKLLVVKIDIRTRDTDSY